MEKHHWDTVEGVNPWLMNSTSASNFPLHPWTSPPASVHLHRLKHTNTDRGTRTHTHACTRTHTNSPGWEASGVHCPQTVKLCGWVLPVRLRNRRVEPVPLFLNPRLMCTRMRAHTHTHTQVHGQINYLNKISGLTILLLISWKWISQTFSTMSSFSKVMKPNPT